MAKAICQGKNRLSEITICQRQLFMRIPLGLEVPFFALSSCDILLIVEAWFIFSPVW